MRLSLTSALVAALIYSATAFAQFAPGPNPITGTTGAQTLSSGTGTVNSGGMISTASTTVGVLISGTATLINNGTIQQTGTGRAIDNTSNNANLTITNTGLISSVTTDAFRINTANTAVSLTNSGTIQVTGGGQAIDWAAITTASNALINQSAGSITAVGEDAVRPGKNGTVNNAGTIKATPTGTTSPSGSDGVDLRTLTGISITNTGSIEGRHGIATDSANNSSAFTLNNNTGGTVMAVNGSGLNIDGVFVAVTANVINQSGATIKGGVLSAATDGDGDGIDVDGVLTLTNSGDVLGLGAKGGTNNPEAIAMGGGTITNNSTGRIIGSSLLADAPNGDSSRIGSGILVDDSNGGNAIAATTITNSGLIQGKSGFGVKIIGTFADTVTNNAGGTIRGAGSGAAIQTGDGADSLTNRGSIIGDGGNAIDLGAGNDTLTIEGGTASISGNVAGGTGSDTGFFDLGSGNVFTFSGLLTGFENIDVASGVLKLDGANRIDSSSALNLKGGTLEVANAGGANGQTFGCLSLSQNSVVDLDTTTSLTFTCFGTITAGKTLSVVDYQAGASPNYAFRLTGDLTADSAFQALLGLTTINGNSAMAQFDGTFTNVTATPEPSTIILAGLGGLMLLVGARRAVRAGKQR